jgi:predicted transcriptional regulator
MKMENTVTISTDDYTAILELAYKAAILQDVLFANAALGYKEKSLVFGANTDLDTVAKYLFPDRYAEKIAELKAAKEDDEQ